MRSISLTTKKSSLVLAAVIVQLCVAGNLFSDNRKIEITSHSVVPDPFSPDGDQN